jgi:hypothetical protein
MRRSAALLAVVLAGAGTASAASADRVVTSPGKVLMLARSGYSVAFLSGSYKGHCGPHVELWNLATGGVYRLGRHTDLLCVDRPSTGSGITDIAVAGNRAAWLTYAGGNNRDWILFTATTTRPTERQIAFQTVDVDAPSPIVLGTASESVIPYAVGSTVKVLAEDGHRIYSWKAPAAVTNLTAYGSQVAVFVRGGRCYVLAPSGAVLQTYTFRPGSVQEFALGGRGLVVQLQGGRVEIHNGRRVRALSIPPQAKMLDYAENTLLYRVGTAVHGRFVVSGQDAVLRHATLATLEHNGLSYAGKDKVYSIAWATVTALLNGLR